MDSQDQREYNEKCDSPNQSTLGQADDQQHVQMHPIEPATVKDTQIQGDLTNSKTSDAESQTDTIKCELPLNKYEVEVVQFWQKSKGQKLVRLKHPVNFITDDKGIQRVQSPTLENLVKFMQEFQDVYLTAQKALHHIYIPANENQSKPLLDLMAFLNETCKNVHCAFCVHGSNLIAVVGFEESVMEQCCKKIKEMMTGKLPDPIAVGVQTEQDQPRREYKVLHKDHVKKPAKDGQAIIRKADNNHGLGQKSTEIPRDRDEPPTRKEFSDIISVDRDVFGYIKLSRSDQIKRIRKKHHVQITPLNHGEVNLQLKISSNSNSRVEKAIADFQDLYQD
uniref:Uncharacterized protein n=1 Tax=Ciona savignyi TaxID=51511 RepID=H2Z387_CIOSA